MAYRVFARLLARVLQKRCGTCRWLVIAMLARKTFKLSVLKRQARILGQISLDSVENRLMMGCRFPSTLGKTACHDQDPDLVIHHGKSILAVNVTP